MSLIFLIVKLRHVKFNKSLGTGGLGASDASDSLGGGLASELGVRLIH